MQHHQNVFLASYWHTSHNGMNYRAHMKFEKSLGEKETCQDFIVILTYLLCVLGINDKPEY